MKRSLFFTCALGISIFTLGCKSTPSSPPLNQPMSALEVENTHIAIKTFYEVCLSTSPTFDKAAKKANEFGNYDFDEDSLENEKMFIGIDDDTDIAVFVRAEDEYRKCQTSISRIRDRDSRSEFIRYLRHKFKVGTGTDLQMTSFPFRVDTTDGMSLIFSHISGSDGDTFLMLSTKYD